MAWEYVRSWAVGTTSSDTVTSATPGGAVDGVILVAVAAVDGVEGGVPTLTITDSHGGTWDHSEIAGTVDFDEHLVLAVRTTPVNEITSVTVTSSDEASRTHLWVHEFSTSLGSVALGDTAVVAHASGEDTWAPSTVDAPADGLVVAGLCNNSTGREFSVDGDYTLLPTHAASFYTFGAYRLVGASPETTGPQWTKTAGSGARLREVVASIVPGTGPQPLSATVAGSATGTVDTPVAVTVTPTGGTAPFTYEWEVVTGAGSFDDDAASSTTYTPTTPGEHVIRCEVTDDNEGAAQDDLTITVTGPETLHLASASGLTPVGAATLLDALSDDDYGTYGETSDDLDGTLTGTLPAIEAPTGDLEVIVPVSVNLGTATVTASISADGSTWVDADTTMPATTTPTTRTFTWAAAGISGYDQDDWQAMQVRVTFTAGD